MTGNLRTRLEELRAEMLTWADGLSHERLNAISSWWYRAADTITDALRELGGYDPGEPEYDIREGVTAEQAAGEVLRLMSGKGEACRPSQLMRWLRLDAGVALDALELLRQRGQVEDAEEEGET